jgi:protein transport protein SEC23
MESEWTQREARDGARSSWNVWPAGERETAKCIVPISTSYTPLKRCDPLIVNYQVQTCGKCGAVLNPHCVLSQDGWICNFCRSPNRFPNKQYVDFIRQGNLPMEMQPQNTTMEYILQDKLQPPIFLFVIDIAMVAEELNQLKDTVQQTIQLMPDDCLVGLITFGNMAYVHEIGFDAVGLTKSYAFRGKKDVSAKQVSEQLGFAVRNDPRGNVSGSGAARFLVPLSENSCEYTMSTLLENLQRDQFATTADKREGRCTGVALSVAVGLLESCCAHQSSKIMLMTGRRKLHNLKINF